MEIFESRKTMRKKVGEHTEKYTIHKSLKIMKILNAIRNKKQKKSTSPSKISLKNKIYKEISYIIQRDYPRAYRFLQKFLYRKIKNRRRKNYQSEVLNDEQIPFKPQK